LARPQDQPGADRACHRGEPHQGALLRSGLSMTREAEIEAPARSAAAEGEVEPPKLADESRWYTEHTALLISTLKWALLGAATGFCVGWGTRAFLWSLAASSRLTARVLSGRFHPYYLLPLALPACVWLIRTFAPTAKGHGTEAVIAAVHQRAG